MKRTTTIGLITVLTGTLAACDAGEPEPRAKRATVRPSVALVREEVAVQRELVDTAVAIGALAPGDPVRSEPAPCREDAPGRHLTGGYRLALREVERSALRPVAARWRAAGHRVTTRRGRFPAVLATTSGGAAYSLTLLRGRGRATLSGGTPCVAG